MNSEAPQDKSVAGDKATGAGGSGGSFVRRNRLFLREFAGVLLLLVLLTAAIGFTGADMALARYCRADGDWRWKDLRIVRTLYDWGRSGWKQPVLLLAYAGLAYALLSIRIRPWRKNLRAALFPALMVALGAGLLVNGVFKDHWGRPRPVQLGEFGGQFTFQQPWQPGNPYENIPGEKKPSFPSGHAAMAFSLMAPWFVLRRRRPVPALLWLIAGIGFGLLVGAVRIAQGGHFLSDVLWAGGIVYLSGLLLRRALRLDADDPAATPPATLS